MGMETGLNIYPVNSATLIFLSNKDIDNEMVPIEEPAVPESVQDLKDWGAIIRWLQGDIGDSSSYCGGKGGLHCLPRGREKRVKGGKKFLCRR
jgi:hypothetical protein